MNPWDVVIEQAMTITDAVKCYAPDDPDATIGGQTPIAIREADWLELTPAERDAYNDRVAIGKGPGPFALLDYDYPMQRNLVYLGGDSGPHDQADARADAPFIALPEWFRI